MNRLGGLRQASCPGFPPERQRHMDISRKRGFHRPGQGRGALPIVDIRFGIYLGIDHAHQPPSVQETSHLAGRIIEVPENTGSGGTGDYAGRLLATFQAALAKIALIGDMLGGMAVTSAVGAGRDTVATIDAD